MRNFFLIEEVKIEIPGRILKIVIPEGRITFREMKRIVAEKRIVMIDGKEFKVLSFDDDMLLHELDEEFTFFGKAMYGLSVEIP